MRTLRARRRALARRRQRPRSPSWCASRASSDADRRFDAIEPRSAARRSTRSGRLRRGLVDAETPRAARDRLRADGPHADRRRCGDRRATTPLAAHAAAGRVARAADAPARNARAVGHAARPGARGRRRAGRRRARRASSSTALRTQVAAGESLPAALARFPRTFSPLYRGLVAAGAETGRLPEVLDAPRRLPRGARRRCGRSSSSALIYPALVTVIALARDRRAADLRRAAGRVGVSAEPADAAVAHAGADRDERVLPRDRRGCGSRGSSRRRRSRSRSRIGATHVSRALASLRCCGCPASGGCVRSLDTARFASTLAILVGSGAPLLRALDAATRRRADAAARDAAARAASALVREGVSLSRALKEQKVFPPVLIHLVANGEQSGAAGADARARGGRARARGRAPAHVGRGADAAGADRRDGRASCSCWCWR